MITPDGTKAAYTVDSDYVDDHSTMFGVTGTTWTTGAPVIGQFIKYSLDSAGKIDEYKLITDKTNPAVSVIPDKKINSNGYFNGTKISASAAIYTYKDSTGNKDITATELTTKNKDYKVVTLDSLLDSDPLSARVVIKDNEIIAMMIDDGKVSSKDVFGLVTEIAAIDDDDYKYEVTMLVDGNEVTYKTDKTASYDTLYKLGFDTAGQIDAFEDAAIVNKGAQLLKTVSGNDTDGIEIKNNAVAGTTLADNVIVYKWNAKDGNFEVGSLSDIETAKANETVKLFDTTTGSDQDYIAKIALVK